LLSSKLEMRDIPYRQGWLAPEAEVGCSPESWPTPGVSAAEIDPFRTAAGSAIRDAVGPALRL